MKIFTYLLVQNAFHDGGKTLALLLFFLFLHAHILLITIRRVFSTALWRQKPPFFVKFLILHYFCYYLIDKSMPAQNYV